MKIKYEASFERDLKNIKEKKLLQRLKSTINEIKEASDPSSIKNLRKLSGYETYYRIRIGDYRVGLEIIQDEVILTRVLHRKDVYKYFPKT